MNNKLASGIFGIVLALFFIYIGINGLIENYKGEITFKIIIYELCVAFFASLLIYAVVKIIKGQTRKHTKVK